jgi:hypothetical protein
MSVLFDKKAGYVSEALDIKTLSALAVEINALLHLAIECEGQIPERPENPACQ